VRLSFSGQSRQVQWGLLIALSAVFAAVLELAGLPAALLLGPMFAGIVLGTNGGTIRSPRKTFLVAQAIIACLIARSITPSILGVIADDWLMFASVVFGVLAAAGLLGWLLTRWQVFPGTTAIWSCWPGGASAMIFMADAYGADARLVAFMQYLRVVMVALLASVVAALWVDPAILAQAPPKIWFPPVEPVPLLTTFGLVVFGVVAGTFSRIPAGSFVVTLMTAAALNVAGLLEIGLPPWLLAFCYAFVGWNVGLNFTREILAHVWRVLPKIFASVMALIAACGGLAWLLHRFAGIDPLTAYLATSPGGADSIAIIASSSHVDVPFVMALQSSRFMLILLVGPHIGSFLARRRASSEEPPPAPLD
jgi:membrane AbrB-like protein